MNAKPRTFGKSALIVGGLLAALTAPGCQVVSDTHQKDVANANNHWHNIRSASMLAMAQQQFDTGDLEQSEKTLINALSIDPTNPQLHVLAGRIAIERGELERAFDRFKTALSYKKDCADAFYYQGIVLQRWQQYQDAYNDYEHAFKVEADNPGFLLAMSEMLVAMDKRGEARQLLESKLVYFDQNAGLRSALGELYAIDGKYDEAVRYLQQASILRPDDLQIVENLATVDLAAGKADDAIQNFQRLIKEPKLSSRRDLKTSLGQAYQQAGRLSDARNVFIDLTASNPRDDQAWSKLAGIAWAQDDLSGALLAAERVMALAPQRPDGYMMAGMVWQKRARYDQSITFFDRAAALSPKSAEPVILRGIALEESGRPDAALAAYIEALKRSPDDHRAQELLARLSKAGPNQ